MAAPLIGDYFRRMGVLPAAPDSIATALAEGHDVALWPGGEIDSLRPWTDRDEAVDPAKAKDDRYVDRKYEEVRQSIQGGMDVLARRRRFPVFG